MLPAVFDFRQRPAFARSGHPRLYEAVGYLGVALWVAIESVIIPIPSELSCRSPGSSCGQQAAIEPITGQPWNYFLVVLAGTLGRPLGALIAYAIGAWGGRPLIERWGRYLGSPRRPGSSRGRFFASARRGRELLRADAPGDPFARLLRGRRCPDAARPVHRLFVGGSLPSPRSCCWSSRASSSARTGRRSARVIKRFDLAIALAVILVVIALVWIWARIMPSRPGRRQRAPP